ncbi:hypothetical protein KPH14_009064 [Odynerus spinipes]|uniref:Uncharacterized protein n=1 Tax=Odynerus spinipes TaxID=1348599 RepID=A0AAD9VQ64_9HYME|nr:hypothetical protein KPH14_009064 [Odynerus spinipes]
MYDYFNMSCLDDKSALRLDIKVNSENLLPQKYNVGSLRLPADPSWPKIPPRKLADDAGDIIQPPCVITLTGTPRRSRTMVRAAQCQPFKTMEMKDLNSPICYLKAPTPEITKRKPGCLDPRFKRVTTGESQATESFKQHNTLKEQQQSMLISEQLRSPVERIEKTATGKNSNFQQITQQGIEKPKNEGTIQNNSSHFTQELLGKNEETNVENNNYTLECKKHIPEDNNTDHSMNINNTIKTDSVNIQENVGPTFKKSKNIAEMEIPTEEEISSSTSNKKGILETETVNDLKVSSDNQPSQSINEPDGQILLVMEKKVKSLPVNKIQIKPISIPQCTTQCYNVQVPIITYQNVPLQISTCAPGEISISSCIANNTSPTSDLCSTTQCEVMYKSSNILTPLLEQQDYLQQKKEVLNTKNIDVADIRNKQEVPVLNKEREDNISVEAIDKQDNYKTFPHNENVLDCTKNYVNVTLHQNLSETNDSESFTSIKVPECNRSTFNQQQKMKSEQNLSQTENLRVNKLSQPYITSRRRRIRANVSKKAKSYFQKRSRTGIVNSDCTLIWPGYQQVSSKRGLRFQKVKQYMKEKNCHYSMLKKPVNERNSNINTNCTAMVSEVENPIMSPCLPLNDAFYQQKEENEYKCLEKANEDDSITNPIRIPLKTQELLNKSYLEYYNKLRQKVGNTENVQHLHQVALGTPKIKRKKSKQFCDTIYNVQTEFNPEVQTIEQCSALSSMINKNLNSTLQHSSDTTQTKQLYVNRNIRSSSDPTGGTQSKIIKKIASKIPADIYENSISSSTFISKVKHKKEKCMEKRFLKLKTIVFFGSMMYALVVFLPMIYDYFFYEDYDDYENLTYIELVTDYVISSFKEAFTGFFNTFYRIFFQPRTCKKCNSIS